MLNSSSAGELLGTWSLSKNQSKGLSEETFDSKKLQGLLAKYYCINQKWKPMIKYFFSNFKVIDILNYLPSTYKLSLTQVIHCRHWFRSHCTCKHKQRPQIDYTVAPGVENTLTAVIVRSKTEKLGIRMSLQVKNWKY